MSKTFDSLKEGYVLVICEKPDAAKRVAEAIDVDGLSTIDISGVTVHVARSKDKSYVVCSALGHLYTLADPSNRREAYPVFDVEWAPTYLVEKKEGVAKRLQAIERLSEGASEFVNACDFDLEGETIGYNILRYACKGKEDRALRAKFSTLTYDELREAFRNLKPGIGRSLAEAGRARHLVDFIWGINLSRALSESFYSANQSYRTISIGRVQGPTLAYVVDREVEIRSFVPIPYWSIAAEMELNGTTVLAEYEKAKVSRLRDAELVKEECEGKKAMVSDVRRQTVKQLPPIPFNIGDLQREAYRVFGYSPSQTLAIAERLYLDALISYPRTSSQKLPPSIDYKKIMKGLGNIQEYSKYVKDLLSGRLVPREGDKEDPAHPAIYPTGEAPKRELETREARLYDLIVKRFFAVFGEDALRERISAVISVQGHSFKVSGRRTVEEGWLKYYRDYSAMEDQPIPPLKEGDVLYVRKVKVTEKYEQPPPRYNQSSLLQKMELEGIGTKTTRAEVISTLYDRGYIVGESIVATDVGFSVVEAMQRYSPAIISTEMTRSIEKDLEAIERGEIEVSKVIERAVEDLLWPLYNIKMVEVEIGKEVRRAIISTVRAQNLLGPCPLCKDGMLTIIRSRSSRKRFVGCTNYSKGCRASAPLPQKGTIKATKKLCESCGWPIIYVRSGRIPWKLCINPKCPSKGG